MRKKKVVLVILSICLIIMIFLGYKKWHYERANAFYLSHKKGESLSEQQKALTNNVNPNVMKKIGVEVTYREKSSELTSMKKAEDDISYIYYPNAGYGSVLVGVTDVKSQERLCSFSFKKNFIKYILINSDVSEEQTMIYSEKSKRVYRQILDDIYVNWEIQ